VIRLAAAAAGLGVAAVLTISVPASADPKTHPIELICDNGVTYWAADSGRGQFTPAHDVATNTVLVPTSFGEFHGVITDSTGAVVEEFTDPPVVKGGSTKPRATSTSCTFTTLGHFEVPELGLLTVTGAGSVEAIVTPAH
jgi:hypothetical protein